MNNQDIAMVLFRNGLNAGIVSNVINELEVIRTESIEDTDRSNQEIENEQLWSSRDYLNKVDSFGTDRFPVGWSNWTDLSDYSRRQLFKHFDEPSQLLGLRLINSREFLENELVNFGIRDRQKKLICDQLDSWMKVHDL